MAAMAEHQRVVLALLDCGKDPNPEVREELENAYTRLGLKDPHAFLDLAREYFGKNRRGLSPTHRRLLFGAMRRVVHEAGRDLPEATASAVLPPLLTFAVSEMVAEREGAPGDWQEAACALVVEICGLCPEAGGQQLLAHVPTLQLPHYFVVRALADFARASPRRFIPHLKDTLTRLLPVLSLVKSDAMRWVVACAIGRFAEAVVQYNEGEAAPLPCYTPSEFAAGMGTVLHVVHGEWVNAKEPKLRAAACEALGCLAPVVSPQVLSSSFGRLVGTLAGLLRRERAGEGLPLVRGLQALLQAAADRASDTVRSQLPDLWGTVHGPLAAICALNAKELLEATKPVVQSELLRCAEPLARTDVDYALTFVGRQLDPKAGGKDISGRVAALTLLRHLVIRMDPELAPHRDTVIATLKGALPDPDYRVRKAVLQVVIALGPSESGGYLACDGGSDLILFVVRNAAIAPAVIADWEARFAGDSSPTAGVGPAEVRAMCVSLLRLFVASMPHLDGVLWPSVLEYLGTKEADGPELFHAFPTVCHCIHSLAERVRDTGRFGVSFETQVNLPRPAEMVAKFLVHVTQCDGDPRGPAGDVVRAMLAVAPLLTLSPTDTAVPDLWAGTVPQLLDYLRGPQFDAAKWEDVAHKLLLSTIAAKADERWGESVGHALMAQLGAYAIRARADHRRVALSMVGAVASKSQRREYLRIALDCILDNTDHTLLRHRQGCARALGFMAGAHGDLVLDKLATLGRPAGRGGGAWLSTLAELADLSKAAAGVGEGPRATALLAYGHAVQRMPQQLMTSRLETTVVPAIVEALGTLKTFEAKEAGLVCVDLLGRGVRRVPGFAFKSKEALLDTVLTVIGAAETGSTRNAHSLTILGLRALTTLLAVEPRLAPATVAPVVRCAAAAVGRPFGALPPRDPDRDREREALQPSKQAAALRFLPEEAPTDQDELLLRQELGLLLGAVLEDRCGSARLMEVLGPLGEALQTEDGAVRARALASILCVLRRYANLAATVPAVPSDPGLGAHLGAIVGLLVPHMADPAEGVSLLACSGLHCVLEAHNATEADPAHRQKVAEMLQKLLVLQESLLSRESKDPLPLAKQIATFLAGALTPHHVAGVLDRLLTAGLLDTVEGSASGACVVLTALIHKTGGRMGDTDVGGYAAKMILAIPRLRGRDTSILGVLHSLRSLAKHRGPPVWDAILETPVPFEAPVIRAIHALGGEPALVPPLLRYLLEIMAHGQLIEGTKGKGEAATVMMAPRVLAAVNVLAALLEHAAAGTADHIATAAHEVRVPMTATLLLLLCVAHEVTKGVEPRGSLRGRVRSAVKQVTATLAKWLRLVYGRHANDWIRQRGALEPLSKYEDAAYSSALPLLCQCLLAEAAFPPEDLAPDVAVLKPMPTTPMPCTPDAREYFAFVLPYAAAGVAGHRLGAVAILGQILFHCHGDADVAHGVLNCLLSRAALEDAVPTKLLALRALGHAAVHPMAVVGAYVTPIATTLLACCGHDDGDVVLRSLATLTELLTTCETGRHWDALAAPICMRLRPATDHDSGVVRGECFRVLTGLCALCLAGHVDAATMENQMFDCLPAILVHINDGEVIVRQPAKQALHATCSWLIRHGPQHAGLKALMERPSYQADKRMEYDEFSREFAAVWVRECPLRVPELLAALHRSMLHAPLGTTRANAAILSGNLVAHLDADARRRCHVEQTTAALLAMAAGDKCDTARQKAVKALGLYP